MSYTNGERTRECTGINVAYRPFSLGPISKYFAVNGPDESLDGNDRWRKPGFSDIPFEDLLEAARKRDKALQWDLHRVPLDTFAITESPWLRRTGWSRTFAGRRMDVLIDASQKPKGGEKNLQRISESVRRVILKCLDGVRNCTERNWMLIGFWLGSPMRNKPESKPFRLQYQQGTLDRYIQYWQRLICFCLRALGDEVKYGVEFLAAQMIALRELYASADVEQVNQAVLDERVFEVSIKLIMHSDYAEQRSVLIYFCCLLGYNPILKQWRKAADYTPILGSIQFCIRVLMLEFAIPSHLRATRVDGMSNPLNTFRELRDVSMVGGRRAYSIQLYT